MYFDLWSVMHFLTGFSSGFLFSYFGLSGLLSLGLVFLIAVLWEVFEYVMGVSEGNWVPVLLDVVLALVGFSLAYWMFSFYGVINLYLGVLFFVFMLIVGVVGWGKYFKFFK